MATRGQTRIAVLAGIIVAVLAVQWIVRAMVDDPDNPTASAPRAPISAEPGLRFSSDLLVVPVGGVGVFRNNDAVAHTFTADGGLFDSGPVEPGKSFSFTFGAAGEVSYHCEIHPSMKGRVKVEGEG